ncbi:MAG: hypothetical protein AAB445_00955 [Patescibacteria group bacterium]
MSTSWREHATVLTLFVTFIVSFAVFLALQAHPVFADPDSFYHARMGVLTAEQGAVRDFPWLPYTTLGQHYIDQHWLYHVLLVPFVTLMDPLAGIKLATVFFAALLITTVVWFLMRQGVRHAWIWGAVLLAATPFTFRMSLAKAPSLSLATLIIGIFLLFNGKRWASFILAWFFVLLYGGFFVLIAAAGIYLAVSMAFDLVQHLWSFRARVHDFVHSPWWRWRGFVQYRPLQVFGCVLGGAAVGTVANPFFPNTFNFLWEQAIQIGVVNFRNVIGVGGEWYPYNISEFIGNNVVVIIPFVVAFILAFVRIRRTTNRSWTLVVLAAFFIAFTLKSRRYVEYAVPFIALAGATLLADVLGRRDWLTIKDFVREAWQRRRVVTILVALYVVVSVPYIIARDQRTNYRNLTQGVNAMHFQASATWLAQHSQKGDVVFHSDWDDFPVLFYYDTTNAYIAGLDPTFLYRQDQERYWAWAKTTLGERRDNLAEAFDLFQTKWILVEKDHTAMNLNVRVVPGVTLAYEDSEVWIYSWPNPAAQ